MSAKKQQEKLILVDKDNNPIGEEEKLKAHEDGLLHRAFSVFIFHRDGRVLLQQRAAEKYHSAGKWSNTCCGHPRPDEETLDAATRRLREEMGFKCRLTEVGTFTYEAKFDNGLHENEIDHVVIGKYSQDPKPNPDEVQGWKWITLKELQAEINSHPKVFSFWLPSALRTLFDSLEHKDEWHTQQ